MSCHLCFPFPYHTFGASSQLLGTRLLVWVWLLVGWVVAAVAALRRVVGRRELLWLVISLLLVLVTTTVSETTADTRSLVVELLAICLLVVGWGLAGGLLLVHVLVTRLVVLLLHGILGHTLALHARAICAPWRSHLVVVWHVVAGRWVARGVVRSMGSGHVELTGIEARRGVLVIHIVTLSIHALHSTIHIVHSIHVVGGHVRGHAVTHLVVHVLLRVLWVLALLLLVASLLVVAGRTLGPTALGLHVLVLALVLGLVLLLVMSLLVRHATGVELSTPAIVVTSTRVWAERILVVSHLLRAKLRVVVVLLLLRLLVRLVGGSLKSGTAKVHVVACTHVASHVV